MLANRVKLLKQLWVGGIAHLQTDFLKCWNIHYALRGGLHWHFALDKGHDCIISNP